MLAALIAVPLALLVHRLGGMVLERVTRSVPALHAMLLRDQEPARFVLPLVALQLVWQAAPDDLRFVGSVRHLNGLLLIAAATWLAVRAVSGFADGHGQAASRRRHGQPAGAPHPDAGAACWRAPPIRCCWWPAPR